MKKKALALLCAMTMVLGMSMTVFAAPSATASGNTGSSSGSSSSSSSSVGAVTTGTQTIGDGTIAEFATVTSVDGATVTAVSGDIAKEAVNEANAMFGANSFIATVVDINVPGATFPYTLTIKNPNVWAGQNVTILHKVNGTWERLTPSSVADNSVTVTVNSFSPFAIAINTAGASPKTQDIALMVGACAALFATGAMLTGKKREQK